MVVEDEDVDCDVDNDKGDDDDAEHCTLQAIKTMNIYVGRIFVLKLLRLAQKLPLRTARLFQHTRSPIAFTPGRFIGPQWAFPPSRGAVEPNRHQIEINKSPLNWTKKMQIYLDILFMKCPLRLPNL